MLVLENTIFTFDQFPNNNVEGQEDTMDPTTLMNDYTQDPNPFSFVAADKIDYDDYCPSPGIVDPLPPQNEENISPIRRHRFSICKATDPQCIINYRRLSNACSSIIPSPNNANSSSSAFGNSMLSASFPNTSFTTTPPLLFEDRKENRKISIINENNEYESYPSPTLENSLFFNASRSYPNITCSGFDSSNSNNNNNSNYNNNNNNNNNFNFNNNNGSGLKPISSPFHTILTPNTFKAILTPDQIIDNVDSMNTNRDLDEQFRLFNYAEEDEDEEDFDDGSSYPSALNSNGQLNLDDDGGMVMLNKNLRFNSNNNIGYSEIVTSNSYDYGTNNSNSKEDIKFSNNSIKFSNNNLNQNEKKEEDDEYDDDNDEEEEDNGKISLEAIHERAELESRVIASIEKNRVEKQIKTYSQNIQGLYGLWKDNQGIGFKTLLRE